MKPELEKINDVIKHEVLMEELNCTLAEVEHGYDRNRRAVCRGGTREGRDGSRVSREDSITPGRQAMRAVAVANSHR